MGKTNYSDLEKEKLIHSLVKISETIFACTNLRFDINGSGYGISKASAMATRKTFDDKLQSKGYTKLEGISLMEKDSIYAATFDLWMKEFHGPRIEFSFNWDYQSDIQLAKAALVIHELLNIITINYAYAYPANQTLANSAEWTITDEDGCLLSFMSEEEEEWDNKIIEIPTGAYKKIYPFNVFNTEQMKHVNAESWGVKLSIAENITLCKL